MLDSFAVSQLSTCSSELTAAVYSTCNYGKEVPSGLYRQVSALNDRTVRTPPPSVVCRRPPALQQHFTRVRYTCSEGRTVPSKRKCCTTVFRLVTQWVSACICVLHGSTALVVLSLLPVEVPRSHSLTHHTFKDSSGRVIGLTQRPLTDSTQQTKETDIRVADGIRTRIPSKRAAGNSRLRPPLGSTMYPVHVCVHTFIGYMCVYTRSVRMSSYMQSFVQ